MIRKEKGEISLTPMGLIKIIIIIYYINHVIIYYHVNYLII